MAFSFAIDTSGAAFDEYPRAEIARIMREQADCIEHRNGHEGTCRDVDGRVVGQWRMVGLGGWMRWLKRTRRRLDERGT